MVSMLILCKIRIRGRISNLRIIPLMNTFWYLLSGLWNGSNDRKSLWNGILDLKSEGIVLDASE